MDEREVSRIAMQAAHLVGIAGSAKAMAEVIAWKVKQRWRKHSGKMYVGNISCPMCGSGTIRCRLNFKNGHLAARCTTANCFAVIE